MNKNSGRIINVVVLGMTICSLMFSLPATVTSGASAAASASPLTDINKQQQHSGAFPAKFTDRILTTLWTRENAAPSGLPPFLLDNFAPNYGECNIQSKASLQDQNVEVVESGDPGEPGETLIVNEVEIQNLLKESNALTAFPAKQRKYKDAEKVALTMLRYALEYANSAPPVSRQTSPEQIRKFVNLYDLKVSDPFCAVGVAYVASKAYCDLGPEKIKYSKTNDTKTFKNVLPLIKRYYFTPHPACRYMMREAKKKRSTRAGGWVAKGTRSPKRGWLVLFDWRNRGDGIPDHVGIVNAVDGRDADKLHTVEFNTSIKLGSQRNGGAVAKKVRSLDRDVLGFIRTY